MSYTILSRLKTTDITNIIGEFNWSNRVFDEKRYKQAHNSGSLRYVDELVEIYDDEDINSDGYVRYCDHTLHWGAYIILCRLFNLPL
tara:strand:- start:77 stop:337 length:261 start_codon:yes stop_codon:yes gene_type:complete